MADIREELLRYGAKTMQAGLVAGAGGNISAREQDTIWMKPSGFAMDDLTPADLCGIDLVSGNQTSGPHKPTSEVNMHLAIYRARPDIITIFHTHSPWACGILASGAELKAMFAEFVCDLGRVGTIPYITPTTQKLANAVGAKAATCDTLFMLNHGVIALGVQIKQAFYRCMVVEDAAKSMVAAAIVGNPRFLTAEETSELMSLDAAKHRIKVMQQRG